ncbi:Na+/H+ antiporter subunit E [Streptomyces aidingensis]|uniref:Multicomponent Na+:H+ antiporter subunit E n=1 Tax=Streptomyces aidingensis TaxID=910347 RepID=A0A1I1FUU2_9ACTN|nr:Na+/H+ antiporter subunit E [Streptomyces aidingensis]SFC03217.1 multicomponent Na+:H+ antiporter subunit E [Streptomyces aidingensis]
MTRRAAVRAPGRLLRRAARLAGFAGHFLRQFLVSNLLVTREILSPRRRSVPAVVGCPLRCSRPLETTLFTALVSLTPGTLALEIVPAGRSRPAVLYVHGMFAADPDAFLAELRDLEGRMLHALHDGPGRRKEP